MSTLTVKASCAAKSLIGSEVNIKDRRVSIIAVIAMRLTTRNYFDNFFNLILLENLSPIPFSPSQVLTLHPSNVSCASLCNSLSEWFQQPPTPVILNRRPISHHFEAPKVPE